MLISCLSLAFTIFYFFFSKGLDLLKENGELALITTNYYPTASGAKRLRSDLKKRACINRIINFNEVKVFESALGQHNMITILSKNESQIKETLTCKTITCEGNYVAGVNQITRILNAEGKDITTREIKQTDLYDGAEGYIRLMGASKGTDNSLDMVLHKMSTLGKPLGLYAEVNQGVLTGCDTLTNKHLAKLSVRTDREKNDGIFVFDLTSERDKEELATFGAGRRLLKDFYKNSDISRYWSSSRPSKKLLYYSGKLDASEYPEVLDHLKKYKPILEERLVTDNEHYHWTAIHRPRNGHVFEKGVPKIVVPYRTKTNAFAYNEIEWFCRSDCYVITSKNGDLELKALLAMLNSDAYYCWLYYRGKRKGETLELFQKPLTEIPVLVPGEEIQGRLADLAEQITDKKMEDRLADTTCLEEEVNLIVNGLFGFSNDEIDIIKKSVVRQ